VENIRILKARESYGVKTDARTVKGMLHSTYDGGTSKCPSTGEGGVLREPSGIGRENACRGADDARWRVKKSETPF